MSHDRDVRRHLLDLLRGGQAHLKFEEAVDDFPAPLRGAAVECAPHTAWELLEHLRLAQRDILEFSRNENGTYRERKFPDDYWPATAAPPDENAWDESVKAVEADAREFEQMLGDSSRDLYAPFPWGDGQTLLREALLVADHNAYHLGQLVYLKKLLASKPAA